MNPVTITAQLNKNPLLVTTSPIQGTTGNDILKVNAKGIGDLLSTPLINTGKGNDYVQLTRNNGTSGNGAVRLDGGEGNDHLLLYGNMEDWAFSPVPSPTSSNSSSTLLANIKTGQSVEISNFENFKFEDGKTLTPQEAFKRIGPLEISSIRNLQIAFKAAGKTPTPSQWQTALSSAVKVDRPEIGSLFHEGNKATNNQAELNALSKAFMTRIISLSEYAKQSNALLETPAYAPIKAGRAAIAQVQASLAQIVAQPQSPTSNPSLPPG